MDRAFAVKLAAAGCSARGLNVSVHVSQHGFLNAEVLDGNAEKLAVSGLVEGQADLAGSVEALSNVDDADGCIVRDLEVSAEQLRKALKYGFGRLTGVHGVDRHGKPYALVISGGFIEAIVDPSNLHVELPVGDFTLSPADQAGEVADAA